MFKIATHAEIEELAEFSWEIQENIATASYPMDRYKSKQDMMDIMHKYLDMNPQYPDDTVLVLREEGKPAAVVILEVEREACYLQTCGIYTPGNECHVYRELMSWCCEHFPGFQLYIGLPMENDNGCKAAKDAGGKQVENSEFLRLDHYDFTPIQSELDIRLLNYDDFHRFADFLNEADKDVPPDEIYWNAERIRENFDIWRIYVLRLKNKIAGCVAFLNPEANKEAGEIMRCCVVQEVLSTQILQTLLAKGIEGELAEGRKYILYSVEIQNAIEREAALQTGFKRTGSYVCYQIKCDRTIA